MDTGGSVEAPVNGLVIVPRSPSLTSSTRVPESHWSRVRRIDVRVSRTALQLISNPRKRCRRTSCLSSPPRLLCPSDSKGVTIVFRSKSTVVTTSLVTVSVVAGSDSLQKIHALSHHPYLVLPGEHSRVL